MLSRDKFMFFNIFISTYERIKKKLNIKLTSVDKE